MHPLDRLSKLTNYRTLFTDREFWTPYVRQACNRVGLPCDQVSSTTPGSFPTFICDRRWVVKFFGPLFAGAESLAVERAAAQMLAAHPEIPTARLVAEGSLAGGGSGWDWPYLIFDFIDGESFGAVFSQLTLEEKLAAALRLGSWMRSLHDLPLPRGGPFETHWHPFQSFLADQRARGPARHGLPPHLAAQVDSFLGNPADWIQPAELPHLIHADLTTDHLFCRKDFQGWQAVAVIDFGDARTGSLYYELAALQLDLFQCDRRLLAAFLRAYRFSPPPDFARRALKLCLLHEFEVFQGLAEKVPEVASCATLAELASRLFALPLC